MTRAKKILIVDDELGIRMLLSQALSSHGYEVSEAENGQDSLEKLKGNRFDLVITDIDMPKLNGIEMLKQMKRAGRKEKVIIMTGNLGGLPEADMPGVVSRLRKPFRMDHLLATVIAAMGNARDRSKIKKRGSWGA